jgi:uncharacterized membrane protein
VSASPNLTPTPPEREQRWSDHDVEQLVGRLLQLGVVIASVVGLAGSAMLLATHGSDVANFRIFRGESSTLRSVSAAVHGAFTLDPRGMVQLGLVLLIATPIARVMFALVGFARQKNWMYVGISAIVLALLAYSLTGG